MLLDLFNRNSRRHLLIEFNPHQILVAGLAQSDRGPLEVTCAAEFEAGDHSGLEHWLEQNSFNQKSWATAACGLVSHAGLLRREVVQPQRLTEPSFIANLLREEYGIGSPDHWTIRVVSPLDGIPLPPDNINRPALISGLMTSELRAIHRKLSGHRLAVASLEPGLLPLFGSLYRHMARQQDKRSVVVAIVEDDQTTAYMLGKEGVHTPAPIRHGLKSILRAAHAEFGPATDVAARLRQPDDVLIARASRLVRALGRELKPLVDSSEMSTGQPVGGIYFPYLPPSLAWIAEPLAQAVERPLVAIDCNTWIHSSGLQAAIGLPPFGPHWLGALSLVAQPSALRGAAPDLDAPRAGPWHVDCRVSTEQSGPQMVRQRFLGGAIAAGLLACVTMITAWQLYAMSALRADTREWDDKLASNEALFTELSRNSAEFQTLAKRLNHAYELGATPFLLSDFVINLGRTLPANLRIDRVESSQGRVVVSGSIHEVSDSASANLTRYLEELRVAPAIGPIFSTIRLTALQRDEDPEWFIFEVTFQPKPLP